MDRQDDVALARDVLGLKVTEPREYPPGTVWGPYIDNGPDAETTFLPRYATAPTSNDMLALIVGMAAKGYEVEMHQCSGFAIVRIRDQSGTTIVDMNGDSLIAAVAEAALRATNNWRDE